MTQSIWNLLCAWDLSSQSETQYWLLSRGFEIISVPAKSFNLMVHHLGSELPSLLLTHREAPLLYLGITELRKTDSFNKTLLNVMPGEEAMALNQAWCGVIQCLLCPMNVEMDINNYTLMWCDPNTMSRWMEECSIGDHSFHEEESHVFLLTAIISSLHYAWTIIDAQ